jgi:hypothetical protein
MESDVRSIDSLRKLHTAIVVAGDRFSLTCTELKQAGTEIAQALSEGRKSYWMQQAKLADRRLQQAQENLLRKKMVAPASENVSSDAKHAVRLAEARLKLCQEKLQLCRQWQMEMHRVLDRFLGQMGPLRVSGDQTLPHFARTLHGWITALDQYADTSPPTP